MRSGALFVVCLAELHSYFLHTVALAAYIEPSGFGMGHAYALQVEVLYGSLAVALLYGIALYVVDAGAEPLGGDDNFVACLKARECHVIIICYGGGSICGGMLWRSLCSAVKVDVHTAYARVMNLQLAAVRYIDGCTLHTAVAPGHVGGVAAFCAYAFD